MRPASYAQLVSEFQSAVGCDVHLPTDYRGSLVSLCQHLDSHALQTPQHRRRCLFAHISRKFNFNSARIAKVLSWAARHGVTFNYHQKVNIQCAFNMRDCRMFSRVLTEASLAPELRAELLALFKPLMEPEVLRLFRHEMQAPSGLRTGKGDRPIAQEILLAALSAFVYSSADDEVLHAYFDPTFDKDAYEPSFWLHLRQMHPALYARHRTLDIVHFGNHLPGLPRRYHRIRDVLLSLIKESYEALANHGHLAIWIDPLLIDGKTVTWELACDALLYAEKHQEVLLTRGFFRSRDIAHITKQHIPAVDSARARFELANSGFTYRDTFVLSPTPDSHAGTESLLIVLQKNEADETLIPCPACRSHNVQGNSYPTLGVKSWECRNVLCPQRTKYNRGKRYSFKALLMQEAIGNPANAIPQDSVRAWAHDVQPGQDIGSASQMLIRHYSLRADGVFLSGFRSTIPSHGRRLHYREAAVQCKSGLGSSFLSSPWFHRYILSPRYGSVETTPSTKRIGTCRLIHGDARTALRQFRLDYFDGAVTSPPYYNAREYSQWDNIYCYLHDMYAIALECFRVLRPGAPYLYNIFDYFDNERSVAWSAMGKKRLILSAYMVDIFRRAGFTFVGSVTWDKGHIEGKRGFNAGNFSPYYQQPFNCWEHILVFYKPPLSAAMTGPNALPAVLRARPVIKLVRGRNVHGHTAPFPDAVPLLLDKLIVPCSRVLDPFAGSGTTGRALRRRHSEVVCVERSRKYVELAERLLRQSDVEVTEDRQMTLL